MRIERVVLIEPKSPGYNFFSGFRMFRLGLPILAAVLKNKGIQTKILIQDLAPIDWEEVKRAELVGFSIITPTAEEGYRLAKKVREWNIPIVFGGTHATFEPEEALQGFADYVVRGEGEETFVELIEALQNKQPLRGIKGLSFKDERGEIVHNERRGVICNLDSIASADFSAISDFHKVKIFPISTSRGCPYDCNFCSVTSMFGRRYRYRSPEKVIAEIKSLLHLSRKFFLIDDNFAVVRERTKELLKMMIREELPISWSTQVRVDIAEDDEMIDLMRQAGCKKLFIGFESINPKSLNEANKKQKIDDYMVCARKLKSRGIKVHGMFIFGFDGDKPQILKKTAKFASKLPLATVQFSILTPIPGSKLYQKIKQQARLLTKRWQFYDGQHVVFQPKMFSPLQLQKETYKAFRKFYSLIQAFRLFINLKLSSGVMRLYGRHILRKWKKAQESRSFLRFLKQF